MSRLLLVRHAESEWNAQGRWQGLADPPLSRRGEDQAMAAGPLLRPMGISAAVSSDLQRARATAERIVPALGVAEPIGIEAGLREYDIGAWSGLNRVQIEAAWPGAIDDWRQGRLVAPPGGEKREPFVARVSAALARVAGEHPGETTLVVTHGGVISAIARWLDAPARRFGHLEGLWIETGRDGLRAGAVVSLLDPDRAVTGEGEGSELMASRVLDTPGR